MRIPVNQLTAACPGCSALFAPGERACPRCGLWLAGRPAAELRWIEAELTRWAAASAWLLSRREELLAELSQDRQASPAASPPAGSLSTLAAPAAPACQVAPGAPADPAATASPAGSAAPAGQAEVSPRTAAHLLLGAGAVLVSIAAAVFTVASWDVVGPLGRLAILLGVTTLVLAAPLALLRRHLTATAESIAALGLALTIGDAYLAQRLIPGAGPLVVAAACAVLAGAWACYGSVLRLRGPAVAAIGMGQLPGLIVAGWLAGVLGRPAAPGALLAAALLVTAGADFALAQALGRRDQRVRPAVASNLATLAWLTGAMLALAGLAGANSLPGYLCESAALLIAAAVGTAVLPRSPVRWMPAPAAATVSGALLAIGLAVPAAAVLRSGWNLAAVALASAAVTGAATAIAALAQVPSARRAAAGSALVLGLTGLIAAPAALTELLAPLRDLSAWAGQGPGSRAGSLPPLPGAAAAPVVLALVCLACLLAPAPWRRRGRATALATAALAAGSLPAAAHFTEVAALAVLTVTAAAMLGTAARLSRRPISSACQADAVAGAPGAGNASHADAVAAVAAASGAVIAASAVLWSLTAPLVTISELAVLATIFCLTAACARAVVPAAIAVVGALATTAGLACAVPLAAGWPARSAAFAVLAVAVAAVGLATTLRRALPVQALALDLGAGPVVLASAVLAATAPGAFAVLAAAAAILASTTACLRADRRRAVALAAACCAIVAALAAQWRSLALAIGAPYRLLERPWHGHELFYVSIARSPGLVLAVVVLGACAAAAVTAAGAWRGSGRGSLDALAVALPLVAAPAGLAGGLGYWLTVVLLLALALALTGWAALGQSLAPAAAAVVAATLAVAWALAAPLPTLIVLGCLTAAYSLCAWRARLASVRIAALWLGALTAVATWCALLAAAGVGILEAYTLPVAVAAIVGGWRWSAVRPELTSWLTYGPGLALLLTPTLIMTWQSGGVARPLLLGIGGAALGIAGARLRLQAPLLAGLAMAVLETGYQLAPAILRLAGTAPGWVPFACIGVVLLWAGATYEARLRNLASVRQSLAAMR